MRVREPQGPRPKAEGPGSRVQGPGSRLLAAVSIHQEDGSNKPKEFSSYEALKRTTWTTTIRDATNNGTSRIPWKHSDELTQLEKLNIIWGTLQDIKAAIYRLSAICKAVFIIIPPRMQDIYNAQLLTYETQWVYKLTEAENILKVLTYIDHWAKSPDPNDNKPLPLAEGFLNLKVSPQNTPSTNQWLHTESDFFKRSMVVIFGLLHVAYQLEEHVFFHKRLIQCQPGHIALKKALQLKSFAMTWKKCSPSLLQQQFHPSTT
eukprot:411726-Rhodomonas_salina.1